MDLVGHEHERVVHVRRLLEFLQVAVELLLPLGEHATTDVLSTEVAGQRIHDDELHVHAAAEALDLVHQENLVSRVVRTGHVNAAEDRVRVKTQSSRHLRDALWAEGVLGVDVEDVAVEAAFGHGSVQFTANW